MDKVKLLFDIEEFKNFYNEKVKSDYEHAKEKYKASRKIYITAFALFLICATSIIINFIACSVTFSCISVLAFLFSYIFYKLAQEGKNSFFVDVKLRHKNYEKVVPKEKYYDYWKKDGNDYIVLIYNILTDSRYKLINISFTERKAENDYLMKIYYSINDKLEIYNKLLCNEIRTDIENTIISLKFNSAWLYIPYTKYGEIKPDVEYYADITELLSSK